MKKGKLICYIISDQQSDFSQRANFSKVLQYVQKNPKSCKMKEKQTRKGLRLLLTFDAIKTVRHALQALESILA